jgi:L-ascorbate metabolism protein UlaG (beta-lactamase superfamily)
VRRLLALLLLASGCGGADAQQAATDAGFVPGDAATASPPHDLAMAVAPPDLAGPPPSLRVAFLGVGGFLITSGADNILTAPLYTHPDELTVSTGTVASDSLLVLDSLPAGTIDHVSGIIAGHAHYDHLLDVPPVMAAAPQATLFSNMTARHILAALAPDQPQRCNGSPPPPSMLDRKRVIAMDDPAASVVDYQGCPDQKPDGAPMTGTWVEVPGAHVRLLALCSMHPNQLGPIHFGAGSIDEDQCQLPPKASDWLEGQTLAYLIDFLDDSGAPRYRLYYQDAPTNAPLGHVPAAVLAEKPVDVALLCVGSYDAVAHDPEDAIAGLAPRYALGGHWENFFISAADPPQPIPFLDVKSWVTRAQAALPPQNGIAPMIHDGVVEPQRAVMPTPGDTFVIKPR